jgi:hypothetical protein
MAIIDQSGNNGVGAPTKQTLVTNYLDFTSGDDGWAKQYLPDLMDKEAEVFGNRTIGGFLEMVGAEEASASDQVLWTEQGRLHLRYEGALKADTAASGSEASTDGIVDGLSTHGLRIGDTVIVSSNAKGSSIPCYVASIFGDADAANVAGALTLLTGEVLLIPYEGTDLGTSLGWGNGAGADDPLSIFVYGSEYSKGTTGRKEAIQPAHKTFKNKMVILKDMYEVSGSDASQIGWVEVSGEDGQNGYLWYLKASGDTRTRFADYCEMAMLESKMADNAELLEGSIAGSEGLFSAVQARGILSDGILGTTSSVDLASFDLILKEFDKQGAIEEYMMFVNRDTSLAIDDMLGDVNSSAGSSFGVFNNEEDMAINLGFSGFRRGSYDFYKSDWKYLNDSQTRGGFGMGTGTAENADQIRGMFVPAGVTSVYDQQLGKNLKRPFLHVRYRASQTENRKFKTWTTGSVGAVTSDLDAMQMHFLSERCLVVQGANNFCQIATSS